MSDFVSNDMQNNWTDSIDWTQEIDQNFWDELEATGWAGFEDATQVRATNANQHASHLRMKMVGCGVSPDTLYEGSTTASTASSSLVDLGAETPTTVDYEGIKDASMNPLAPCRLSGDGVESEQVYVGKRYRGPPKWRCPYSGCYQVFRRSYELDRHIGSAHEVVKPFVCPYPGCFKVSNTSSFSRSDKLTDHIRSAHHRQRGRPICCPERSCKVPAMELDVLGMHIRMVHGRSKRITTSSDLPKALRPIFNAASPKYLICPLWRCSKSVSLKSLIPHLMEHSLEELESSADELLSKSNLIPVVTCQYSTAGDSGPVGEDRCSSSGLSIKVLCPICRSACNDHSAFEAHFNELHAIAPHELEHYRAWQRYITNEALFSSPTIPDIWSVWKARPKCSLIDIVCPYCDFQSPGKASDGHSVRHVDHHIPMFDTEKIKPFRWQVLKLYPGFATHPVWNDLGETYTTSQDDS